MEEIDIEEVDSDDEHEKGVGQEQGDLEGDVEPTIAHQEVEDSQVPVSTPDIFGDPVDDIDQKGDESPDVLIDDVDPACSTLDEPTSSSCLPDAAHSPNDPVLISDSPLKDDKTWCVPDCAKKMIETRAEIDDKISEVTAMLSKARKRQAAENFGWFHSTLFLDVS